MNYPKNYQLDYHRKMLNDFIGAQKLLEQKLADANNDDDKALLKGAIMINGHKIRNFRDRVAVIENNVAW